MPTWTHSMTSVSLLVLPRPMCDAGPLAALAGQMWHVGPPWCECCPTESELTVLLLSLAANQVNGGQRVATVLMYLSDVDEGELVCIKFVLSCPVVAGALHGAVVPCAAALPPTSCMRGAC